MSKPPTTVAAPRAVGLTAVVAATFRTCLRHRVTGLAAEAGFFALLSLPSFVLGIVASAGYVGRFLGTDLVGDLRSRIARLAATALTPDVVHGVILRTFDEVVAAGRPEVVSVGFLLSVWSGSRALNVYLDTVTIMYGLGGRRGIVRTRRSRSALRPGAGGRRPRAAAAPARAGPAGGLGPGAAGAGACSAPAAVGALLAVVRSWSRSGLAVLYRRGAPGADDRGGAACPVPARAGPVAAASVGCARWSAAGSGGARSSARSPRPWPCSSGSTCCALAVLVGAALNATLDAVLHAVRQRPAGSTWMLCHRARSRLHSRAPAVASATMARRWAPVTPRRAATSASRRQ